MATQFRNILLVEDNQDHAELTTTSLQTFYRQNGEGAQIRGVTTGEECLRVMTKDFYDVIIIDYHLPSMNGVELLKCIRKKGIKTPVVMVTGSGNENIAVDAIKKGASEYVVKRHGYLEHLPLVIRNSIDQFERRQEKERLEEELKGYQIELEMSKRLASIGEMASRIAHDIRNPLSRIKMGADFLKKTNNEQDGATSRVLDGILDGVENLNRIATELLKYAKPPAPIFHVLDICRILDSSLNDLEDHIVSSGVVVIKEYCQDRVKLRVDGVKIKEVFINIIKNALEAVPMGGILKIKTSWTERCGIRFLDITFEDTGHGISKKNMEKIFAPFFTTKATGTGIGLSVVKKIMEIHDGHVDIKSRAGKGTVVTIQLRALEQKDI